MKHIKAGGMLLLALLLALSWPGVGRAEGEKKALTLMIYMTGSDLETLSGAATADITEMLRAGANMDRVNVLVCTGGSRHWQGGFPSDRVCLYRVEGRRPAQLAEYGARSMGESATLSGFLNDAVARCPAEQYALILWDHGAGPMNGVCFDELHKKGDEDDSLELTELEAALRDSPFGGDLTLEWIGFDACLMATVETAHVCAPFAKYMIASQETEPGSGWNYGFLSRAHEGLSGEALGSVILDGYMEARQKDEQQLTLSCVDLSKLGAVETALEDLFGGLTTMLEPQHFSTISNGRRDAKSFGRTSTGSEYDLVDLYSIAEQYADQLPEGVKALQEALMAAVVKSVGNQENSHGLSLYYPYYNKEYFLKKWQNGYDALDFAPKYSAFMRRFTDVWLGERLANWSDIHADALPVTGETQPLSLQLTQEQLDNFASAQVVVMTQLPVEELCYYKIDEIDGIVPDGQGMLRAEYDYRALYAMDEDGNPLGDALPYTVVDGMYLIRANLSDKTFEEYWDESFPGDLRINEDATMECRKGFLKCREGADDTLEVVGFISMLTGADENGPVGVLQEGEGLYMGKQTVSVASDDWKWVWFLHFPREVTFDETGAPRAFPEWDNPNTDGQIMVEWDYVDNEKPWKLQFRRQQFSGFDLFAQFVVRDTQGNLAASNLTKIDNPNVESSDDSDGPGRVDVDTPDYRLTLKKMSVSNARFDDGLLILFELEQRGAFDSDISIRADSVMLNRCLVKEQYTLYRSYVNGRRMGYMLNIPSEDMPAYLEDSIDRVKFDLVIGLNRYPIELEGPMDISGMHKSEPIPAPLAEGTCGGLRCGLVELAEEDDGIDMTFIVENPGSAARTLDLDTGAWVDDSEWETAVTMTESVVPTDSWRVVQLKLSRRSAEADSIFNDNGVPQVDYPAYWGIDAIHTIELTDRSNGPLRLSLKAPFALSVREEAPPEVIPLTRSADLEVALEGCLWKEDRLLLLTRVKNTSGRTLMLTPRNAFADGVEWNVTFSGASVLFNDYPDGLAPGRAVRMVWRVDPYGDSPVPETLGEVILDYKYTLGEEEYFSTLTIDFDNTPLSALNDWYARPERLTIAASEPGLNTPVDPFELVDPEIPIQGNPSDCAVTFTVRLSDEQAAAFDRAKVWLVYREEGEGMRIVSIIQQRAVLGEDNALSVDFGGMLVLLQGARLPMTQIITPMPNSCVYELRAVKLLTDNDFSNDSAWLDELYVMLDDRTGGARITKVTPSREVGCMERVTSQSYMSPIYDYENGEGTGLEYAGKLRGETGLQDAPLKLCMRPVRDFDLLPVFNIVNKDGSSYTLPGEMVEIGGARQP